MLILMRSCSRDVQSLQLVLCVPLGLIQAEMPRQSPPAGTETDQASFYEFAQSSWWLFKQRFVFYLKQFSFIFIVCHVKSGLWQCPGNYRIFSWVDSVSTWQLIFFFFSFFVPLPICALAHSSHKSVLFLEHFSCNVLLKVFCRGPEIPLYTLVLNKNTCKNGDSYDEKLD